MAPLNRLFILLAVLCLPACGLTLQKQELSPPDKEQEVSRGPLRGSFTALDGSSVDLAPSASQIQVVMFVSETCSICRRETQALVLDRGTRGKATNAAFYSIVVGSIPDDAADWKSSLGVDWLVGTDSGDKLFREYCPEAETPCVLLHNPSTNANTKLIGEHSPQDWENFTGNWSF